MAIKLEKSKLAINQVITNKKQTIEIDGDCIVPDVKPDILEIVGTSGIVNIYKKEVMDGKVRVDGSVNVYVMYIGDDGKTRGVRSINHTLDFSQSFNVDNVTSDMNENIQISLGSIDCKIINERKVNLKASLGFEITILANSEVEFVNNVDLKDIQKLESTIPVNVVLGVGQTKTLAKETVNIDSNDNLAEILKVNSNITNKSIKVSYNKILTKADIRLKILYLTEDGRINTVNAKFPIMGFIDMQDINENNPCEYDFEIKNMVVKPNSVEEHSIYVEIEVGINATAYNNKEINVIQDLYSPSTNLKFEQSNIKMIQNKAIFDGTYSINQKELLDIGDEKVYDVDTDVVVTNSRISDNEVLISGNVNLFFTCSSNGMTGIQTRKIDVPFESKISCNGINSKAKVKIKPDVILQDFNIMPGGEVNIKIDLGFNIVSSNDVDLKLINNIEELENEYVDDYNMVIYQVKPNDSLWKIAKKFNSTVQSIIDTNELKSDKIFPGDQLFIEKYMG